MIVTIGNSKGGVGKSTISCNLAVVAAKKGKKVLVIDADVQGSTMNWRTSRQTDDIQAMSITSPTLHKDLAAMKGFDLILIDAGGRVTKTFLSALMACSVLVIPCLPSQVDFWAVADVIDLLRDARDRGLDIKASFVLNQVIPNTIIGKEAVKAIKEYEKSDGIKLFNTILYARVAYKNTYGVGRGVVEDTDSKAIEEMQNLYKEILKIGGKK